MLQQRMDEGLVQVIENSDSDSETDRTEAESACVQPQDMEPNYLPEQSVSQGKCTPVKTATSHAQAFGIAIDKKVCKGCQSPSLCQVCPFAVANKKELEDREEFHKIYPKFKEAEAIFISANVEFVKEWKIDINAKLSQTFKEFLSAFFTNSDADKAAINMFKRRKIQIKFRFESDMIKLLGDSLEPIRKEMNTKFKKYGNAKK